MGEPEAKRLHGRCKRRWKDNIKMDVFKKNNKEYALDLSGSGHEQASGAGGCSNENAGCIKCGQFCTS